MKNPNSFGAVAWHSFKVTLCLSWSVVPVAAGLALTVTVVGFPLAMLCFAAAAWPLKRTLTKRIERRVAWQFRDQPLDQGPKPWRV